MMVGAKGRLWRCELGCEAGLFVGEGIGAGALVFCCLTIESEEREAWTADVLAGEARALLKRDTLTVTLS